MEALGVIADEESTHGQTAFSAASNNSEDVDDGQVTEKAIGGVIEHGAHRILGTAHDALHAVDSAEIMAAINAIGAASADEDVLGVIGHAYDFVRYNLTYGEDEIEVTPGYEAVDLRRPRITQFAFGLFSNEFDWNFAKSFYIGAPVVDMEEALRDIAEHVGELVRVHCRVCAESGQHSFEAVTVVLPGTAG